jgi:plastocyanin
MQRNLVAAISVSVSAVCLSACGSEGGPITPGSPSPVGFTITVNRQNGALSFSPNPAAAGGQMVVFRNADSIVHRVLLNDLSIDTGDIAPGATSRAIVMPAGGTNYHCTLHPDMVGSVNAATGAPPPPCEGVYCNTD